MKDIMQWRLLRKSWLAAERKITTAEDATAYLEHKKHHIHKDDLYVWQNRPSGGRDVIYWYAQCSLCGYRHSFKRADVPQRLTENHKRAIDWDTSDWLRYKYACQASDAYAVKRVNYLDYLESADWQEKRQAAFEMHGKRCQICLDEEATQIHHLTYANLGHEKMTDLMPLCRRCHKLIHDTDSSIFRGADGISVFCRKVRWGAPIAPLEWLSLANRLT